MLGKTMDGVAVLEDETAFRKAYPNISFPRDLTDEILAEYGRFNVVLDPYPQIEKHQTATKKTELELIDGVWHRGWTITETPVEKIHVDAERDRRILLGFAFNGKTFQADPESVSNIQGAGAAALAARMAGVAGDNLRWANPDADFTWLATDNTLMAMGPDAVIAFGNAVLAHKSKHIFAGRALKSLDPIPHDYTDDKYWP